MTERPILFSGAMVRALLAGTKTQTRRVVTPQPIGGDSIEHRGMDGGWIIGRLRDSENAWRDLRCPFGERGDRLWVREAWASHIVDDNVPPREIPAGRRIWYRATDEDEAEDDPNSGLWRPGMFMPRRMCRLVLEVRAIRAERVQSISGSDAVAEGMPGESCPGDREACPHCTDCPAVDPLKWYLALWDLLNDRRGHGWKENPWVWVVEFKTVVRP